MYGPRQLIKHNRQGFIAWFIRLVLEDREMQVFGDGSQIRDFVYVDDAVEAFLSRRACATRATVRRSTSAATNTSPTAISCSCSSNWPAAGRYGFVEWPPEKKAIDIGSFYADSVTIHGDDAAGARE